MTDLWKDCFLAALTGYIAQPLTGDAEIACDDIAQFAANQADEAVLLIERRWPVKQPRPMTIKMRGQRPRRKVRQYIAKKAKRK
jgi:vacuolar-type H+-ATPase catalytic subunit A/Vma1